MSILLNFHNDNDDSDHNIHNDNDNDNGNNNYAKMLEDNGQKSRLVTLRSHGRLQKITLCVIILRIFKE